VGKPFWMSGLFFPLMKRDSIIFYRSFYEAIKELPAEIQAAVYNAIFEYSLNFNQVELQGLPKTIFTLIKPQLDANNKRFENGSKGGRKKANVMEIETKKEPKQNQNETKVEANNNVNDNNNNNSNENVLLKKETKSKKEKIIKIKFDESEIFEPKKFSEKFNTWNKKKLRHYYESAISYSKEGHRYVDWAGAISNWARKDELQGKLKFDDNVGPNDSGYKPAPPPETIKYPKN